MHHRADISTDELALADGTMLRLRPIGVEDREALATLFTGMSPESRRRRFLGPKPELTARELTALTNIDHVSHEAIAAFDPRDGSIAGVARYAADDERPQVAEVAAAVADRWQGMGIGTALARRTAQRARANGFTLLTASTLRENRPALALLRRFGARPGAQHGSVIEYELGYDAARVAAPARVPVSRRILATVLFTDLVDSTQVVAESGDHAWAGVRDRHLDHARAAVAAHGGETIQTTGDGVLALFPGPGQGVRCAERVIADAEELGLEVRTGLHTGEVERTSDDVAGLAVHLAARIVRLAQTGEILVSRTVRDLVIGSELAFTARGEHDLKGLPDRWALYAAA